MDDLTQALDGDHDTTQPLTDEDTVEYIERLLAAIDRLRDERDSLRRDIQFLESESRFAIEALEMKLSRSVAASTTSSDDILRTMNQMKMEMDALHAQLEEVRAAGDTRCQDKTREIQRLGQALAAFAVVVTHSTSGDVFMSAAASTSGGAHVEGLDDKLEAVLMRLEAMSSERDELADALRQREEDVRNARLGHQDATRNNQDLSNEIDSLSKTVDLLESERNSLAIHIKNVETDLQRVRDELATAESRYSDLQFHQLSSMSSSEATHNLRNQIKELEGRVVRRNEQLGIHQHDIRRLETNLRLQEERLNEMTTELEMTAAEKVAMVEDCADARDVRDEALRKAEEMEEAMENMEHAAEETEATVISLLEIVFDTVTKSRLAISMSQRQVGEPEELRATLELVEDLKEDNIHLEKSLEMYNERINQLTANIVNLEGQHAATIAVSEDTKAGFHTQIIALQDQLEEVTNMKASMEQAHSLATRELEAELDRLRQRVRDTEVSSFREASKDEDFALLHSRIAELQATLAQAEAHHAAQLEELHTELESLTMSKQVAEDQLVATHGQAAIQEAEHERASSVLQVELVKERQNLKQAQQSFEEAEQARQKLLVELSQLKDSLDRAKQDLEVEKSGAFAASQGRDQELDALTAQVNELTSRLEKMQVDRESIDREHQAVLSALREQRESEIARLKQEIEEVRRTIGQAEDARVIADNERTAAQEQLTDLVAKIEQNKSLQRSLEGQIEERFGGLLRSS
jgi:myosin protein heavy chain